MNNFDEILSNLSILIRKYPIYFFGFITLFLASMILILILNQFSNKNKIKRIKSLLIKNPDKALNKLEESNLDIIDYFTKQENLNSNEYIKIKTYLTQVDQVRKIYDKISYFKNNKTKTDSLKLGISILSRLTVPQAIDYLITFLYENNKEIKILVLEELKNTKSDKVIYSLLEFIKYTKDNEILSTLINTLKEMGEDVFEKITPLMYKADPNTTICYLDIIGEYQNEDYLDTLVKLLDTENPEVKIHVIQKLESCQLNDNIINKIIKLLEDEHWGVKSQSIKLLEKLEIVKAVPFLAKNLTDKSGVVRATATKALLNLGYEGVKYIFELAKQTEAPKEVKDALKKQDIAFLIEAMENVYQKDINTKTEMTIN